MNALQATGLNKIAYKDFPYYVHANPSKADETEEQLISQGLIAQYGFFGEEKSAEQATKYYTKAINQHNSSLARCNLGALLMPENSTYFQDAMRAYYAPLLYYIAISKSNVCKAEEEVDYLRLAAQQDYPPAQCQLAISMIKGLVGKENAKRNTIEVRKQIEQLEQFADNGYSNAQCFMGKYLTTCNPRDMKKALSYTKAAADQNHPEATYRLAMLYMEGKGVKQDIANGEIFLEKALALNSADAQCFMGKKLANSSPTDLLGVNYLKAAAAQKHPEATYRLAMLYMKGKGVKQNKTKSQTLLQVAADFGNADAQTQLALIKLHRSVASHKAKNFLTLAEQQKHSKATYCLGEMYYSGDHKLIQKRDLAKAGFYFRSALARDFGAQTTKLEIEKKINKAEKHALKKHPSLHSDLKYAFNLYEEDSFEECYELLSGKRVRLLPLHLEELRKKNWQIDATSSLLKIGGGGFITQIDDKDLPSKNPEAATSNLEAFLKQYGLLGRDKAVSIEDAIANYTADDPSAWCHIGILNIDKERFDDAEQLFQKASNKDFPAGHYGLAKCLFYRSNNPGSEQTLKKEACDLLQKAAKQAFAPAQYSLGCHIMKTELLKLSPSEESSEEQPTHISHWKNIEKATQLISDAADQKFAPAEYTKALLILKGNILIKKKRKATAKKLIESAAKKGYAPAINALGENISRSMKILGASLSFNSRAEQLFLKANELGYPPAAYNLGRVYEHGDSGTKDRKKAVSYYQEAANSQVDNADKKLQKLRKNTNLAPNVTTQSDQEKGLLPSNSTSDSTVTPEES